MDPFIQLYLATTHLSYSFAFLVTEQLNLSKWGFNAFSKGTSKVAAEKWENIIHSFKQANHKACFPNLQASTICHLCIIKAYSTMVQA